MSQSLSDCPALNTADVFVVSQGLLQRSVRQILNSHASERLVMEIIEWMYPWAPFSDDRFDYTFSFPRVCSTLGINPYETQIAVWQALQEKSDDRASRASYRWRIAQIESPIRSFRCSSNSPAPFDRAVPVADWSFSMPVSEDTFSSRYLEVIHDLAREASV